MSISDIFKLPEDPDRRLNILTNIGILIAIALGIIVAVAHGGGTTVTIAAFGASLGVGGVLGFLFGVPGPSQAHITIGHVDTVVGGGTTGGAAVNQPAPTPPTPAVNGPGAAPPAPDPAAPANNGAAAAQPAPDPAAPANNGPGAAQPAPDPAAPVNNGPAAAQPAPDPAAPVNNGPGAAQPAPDPATPVNNGAGAAQPAPDPAAPVNNGIAAAQPASNLEQVADWVTKLLLGGGLTQMQRIPPKIWQWSRNIAIGIDPKAAEPTLEAEQAFAAGVLVYGFVLGFFAGFLITKLQLGKKIN